ncbi:MAG: hypothetical protein ACE5LS_00535 [Thermoplasmata archaeon]
MKTGSRDGLDVLYDDEAELLLAERERVYARRGLILEAFRGGGLSKRPFLPPGLWMIYHTNQRVVGLRDPKASSKEGQEGYAGTLQAIDRTRYLGPKAEESLLEYFEFPLRDVEKVSKRSRKHLQMVVRSDAERYLLRFRPWGAACRAFSVLLRQKRRA